MECSKDLVDAGETALDLLSPANEPKQRVAREGWHTRDRLFGIVADAYPYLPRERQLVADWLYDMHVRQKPSNIP